MKKEISSLHRSASKDALIIGSSVAGLQAALDLADSGITVHLVEPTPFLGNSEQTEYVATVPRHLLNARLLEIAKHPNIRVWTNTRLNRLEGEVGHFHVELRRHPRYVDLAKCTGCGDCIAVCPVTVPGTDHKVIHLDGQPGCAAIDKLGKPPCANTCPGGIHVQGYVALIAQGRFQEAIDLIREAIPFPGICGRVCTHPCEINCRRAEVDKPVAVRLLKRFVSDWELAQSTASADDSRLKESPPYKTASKPVAVVGAGPGGMAVADRLARLGYQVTVFEKLPVIGGMMVVGIPEYRLPREVISREYQHILDLGVEVRLNTAIGPSGNHTLDDLFAMGYEAICLAIGAHKSQNLRIPGEDLPGVVHGIQLLKDISFSFHSMLADPQYRDELHHLLPSPADAHVAILGGGNTAMDVSRSLLRLGVQDVRILYRRSRREMPAMPEEVEDAEREGVKIEFLVSPVRILGDQLSGVTGLECVRMKLGEPDASGRRRPVPIAGSEFVVSLDLVVLAIGQAPELDLLGQDHGLAITRDDRINVAGVSYMTNRPGIFAVGDAVTTDKMAVIEAIGMGKEAAASIDAYLRGQPPQDVAMDSRQVPIARREMTENELVPKPRIPVPTIPMQQRLNSYAEVELGYTAEQAMAEAQRCLVCGPCSECQACVQVCKPGAILHDQHETFAELDIGAILYADDPTITHFPLAEGEGLYHLPPGNPLLGAAAAARVMADLKNKGAHDKPATQLQALPIIPSPLPDTSAPRVGVFICQCGDEIAKIVDTETVRLQAATLPAVVHTQVLPFSCSPDAAQTIQTAITAHNLDRIVLAACSCCALDQVCYSCTYQRLRCKSNLGIFPTYQDGKPDPGDNLPIHRPEIAYEFVNIREQCAWVHADDPQAATLKATALIAAAVARSQVVSPLKTVDLRPIEDSGQHPSVLILGRGAAARTCRAVLSSQGMTAQYLDALPAYIHRAAGQYIVSQQSSPVQLKASTLVLAPRDPDEAQLLLAAFGEEKHHPRPLSTWGGLDTHRPGIFFCDSALDPKTTGAAVAARVTAWLEHAKQPSTPVTAVVDPARCRACGTCVEICEFGAPLLIGEETQRTSWIDPSICTACGVCAVHCPSGAITVGSLNDAHIEAMLDAILKTAAQETRVAVDPPALAFICNWNSYSGLESAGASHISYSPDIYPIRVACLGQISPGLLLKAFEKGASGMLMLGCPTGDCHYEFGNCHAEQVFAQAKSLAALLGYQDAQLKLDWVAAGEGKAFAEQVQAFISGLSEGRSQ